MNSTAGSTIANNNSFELNYALPWKHSFNNPHHLSIINSNCSFSNNGNPIRNCLVSRCDALDNYSEGIHYDNGMGTDVFRVYPFTSYTIQVNAERFYCSSDTYPEFSGGLPLNVRAANGIVAPLITQAHPLSIPYPYTQGTSSTSIGTLTLIPSQVDDFIISNFVPTIDYRSIQIYPSHPTGGTFGAYFSIRNVIVTCQTTALTPFICTNNGLDYTFITDDSNLNEDCPFATYSWDFGDGGESDLPNPMHTFAGPGTYNVCLDIVDCHGCCDQECKQVVVSNNTSCLSNLPPTFFRLNGPQTLLSNLMDSDTPPFIMNGPGIPTISNVDIAINGTFIIDRNINFNNVDFVFGEGSEVIVNSPLVNFTFCTFQGCDVMWRGIRYSPVPPNGPGGGTTPKYNFSNNSLVSDARRALTLDNITTISVSNNIFENNLIGIESHDAVVNNLKGNIFRGNGNLFPTYSGFETPGLISTPSISFAGINLVKQNKILYIGSFTPPATTISNEFLNMRNGIVANNSRFEVRKVQFQNINQGVSSSNIEGFCVHAANCSRVISDNSMYKNSQFAIYADGQFIPNSPMTSLAFFTLKNNLFENINNDIDGGLAAVTLKNYNNGEVLIDKNSVRNCFDAFNISNVNNYTAFTISQTGLPFELPDGSVSLAGMTFIGTGYFIDNCKSEIWGTIESNFIGSNNFASAFNMINCNRFLMKVNNIYLTAFPSTSVKSAIFLNECDHMELRHNFIQYTGATATDNNFGLHITSSDNVLYCWNTIDGASTAMRLASVNMATRYRQNRHIDSKLSAMLLRPSSSMGPQFYASTATPPVPTGAYGNLFNGNIAVLNQGNAELSRFRIDDDPASSGTYNPNDTPSTWFTDQQLVNGTSNDPLCNVDEYDGDGPWICGVPLMLGAMEEDIDGTQEGSIYEDQSTWSAQNFVYDYAQMHPQLAAVSSAIGAFFNNPPTVLYQYQQIEDKLKNLYLPTVSESNMMDNYSQQNASFTNQLDSMSQIMSSGGTVAYSNYSVILDALNSNALARKILDSIIQDRAIFKASNIVTLVTNLAAPYNFLVTYKQITQIYLSSIINGIHSLTPYQVSQVNSIAGLCPEVFGRAVFMAHSLRTSLGLEPIVLTECNNPIPRSKSIVAGDGNFELVSAHPNPTTSYWLIDRLEQEDMKDLRLELYTSDGRKISDELVTTNDVDIKVGSEALLPGIYVLQVSDDSGKKQYIKLIKTR